MDGGEGRWEEAEEAGILEEGVLFGEREEPEDLIGGWTGGGTFLRVDGYSVDVVTFHGMTSFTFDESLDEEGDEEEEEEGFNASLALEEDGGELDDGLELLETFLNGRLTLVSFEDLSRGQRSVVGEQGIHAV